jgi:hypothetical protein
MREYNPPMTVQIYLGSGKRGEKLRENLDRARGQWSLSEYVVALMKKAEPKIFKGLDDGKN